jgi:hypothetical protein
MHFNCQIFNGGAGRVFATEHTDWLATLDQFTNYAVAQQTRRTGH